MGVQTKEIKVQAMCSVYVFMYVFRDLISPKIKCAGVNALNCTKDGMTEIYARCFSCVFDTHR